MGTESLMRECVNAPILNGETGAKNQAFDIKIPDGHAMILKEAEFIYSAGTGPVANRHKFYLVDDVDETADPGHTAEKVITSTEFLNSFTTSGRSHNFVSKKMDCHDTLLVVNPNFITNTDVDPTATINLFCRIWFDFVKVTPKQILDLLRQQQY